MTLRPSKFSARFWTVGALAIGAAVAASTIIAVQAFAQNRPSKRVSDKTPSVIVDLGVLEELGQGAAAPEPAAKPPIAAPILRAPPKRPGAPPPLFLPPRSADERMAHKGSETANPKAAAKTAAAKKNTGDTKAKKNTRVAAAAPVSNTKKSVAAEKQTVRKPAAEQKKTVVATSGRPSASAKSKPVKSETARHADRHAKPAPAKTVAASEKPAKHEKSPAAAPKPVKTAAAEPAKGALSAKSKETAHKAAKPTAMKVKEAKAPASKPKPVHVAKPKAIETEVVATVEKTPEIRQTSPSASKEPATSRIASLSDTVPAMPEPAPPAPIKSKPSADAATEKKVASSSSKPAAAKKADQALASRPRKPVEPSQAATSPLAKAENGKSKSAKPLPADPAIESAKIAKPTNWMASLVSKPPKSTPATALESAKPAGEPQRAAASKPARSAPQPIKVARAMPEAKAKPKPASKPEFSFDDPIALSFSGDATDLNADATRKVKALVKYLKEDERLRLKLMAYADGANRSPREIRQLSLFRALSVRAQLLKRGISSARIEVQPRGDNTARTPRDRVDLVVSSR